MVTASKNNALYTFLSALSIILLIWLVYAFSFTPIRTSNDIWWQLKTGKYLWEHGFTLPENDIFAFASEDIPWHNHEWLSQILMYGGYLIGEKTTIGGVRTVIIFKTCILIVTFLILLIPVARRCGNVPAATLIMAICAAVARRSFMPRPPVVTYLFLAIFIWLLFTSRERKKKIIYFIILPLMMILWANLHGGFMAGLVVVGLFFTGELIERRIEKKESEESSVSWTPANYFALLVLLVIASLINPFTYKLYLLPVRVMSDPNLVGIIPEMQSPDFFFTRAYEFMLIVFFAGFSLIRKERIRIVELLILLFFFHQSINHMRHLPLFAICTAPIMAWIVGGLIRNLPEKVRTFSPLFFIVILVWFVSFSIFHHREGMSYHDRNMRLLSGVGYEKEDFPEEVSNFILANDFKGRMFNQINYAGYLIWKLSPETHKIFTDPRYDIFGSRFVWDNEIIAEARKGWEALLDKWEFNFIVVHKDSGLSKALRDNDMWGKIYSGIWNVYVKNIPLNQELIGLYGE